MKKLALFLVLALCLMPILAQAQEAPVNPVQSINISNTIDSLRAKAINTGMFYNWKSKALQPTYTYNLANWKSWDILNIGYASPNVLLASSGYMIDVRRLLKKYNLTIPFPTIQNIVNNLTIDINANVGLQEIGGKNKFTGGPGITIKVKI